MLEIILSLFFTVPTQQTNYDKVVQTLRNIEVNSSGNATLFELGKNNSNQPIYGLKIGFGPTNNLIVGTHHGNEYGSTAVAMGMADSLAKNPIQDQTVYVIPVLNIDGYNRLNRYENNIDPNRNYPGPCGTQGPFTLSSTKSLADFIEKKNIISSATLHTYAPAALYPWGISTQDTATKDEAQFIQLAKAATQESQYQYGNSTELLYAADGTFEDYAYWKHGIWSLLFELGYSHYPNESDLKEMVTVNVPGIRRFLELAPKQRSQNFAFTGQCDRTVPQRFVLE
jgi:carboxypeptidase T